MTWFLFVIFGGDYTDRVKRWQFETEAACEQVKDFVAQDVEKALCVADGYGAEVQVRDPLPNPVKEWTGPIEGETP